jgi:hypothetical protein
MFHLAFFAAMSFLWETKRVGVPIVRLEWDMAHTNWAKLCDDDGYHVHQVCRLFRPMLSPAFFLSASDLTRSAARRRSP